VRLWFTRLSVWSAGKTRKLGRQIMGETPAVRGLIALTVTSSESTEPMEREWKVLLKGGKCINYAYVQLLSSSGSDSEMLVTVSSITTVPSPLELSAILSWNPQSWNSQSYSEMPTINQLNSGTSISISSFLHFLISHFLISSSCF